MSTSVLYTNNMHAHLYPYRNTQANTQAGRGGGEGEEEKRERERESKRANREEATPAACEYSSLSTCMAQGQTPAPTSSRQRPWGWSGHLWLIFGHDVFLGIEILLAKKAKHPTCTGDRVAKGTS